MRFIIAPMENFSNIKLIAFDVDGTLAETDEYYIDKVSGAIRKVLPFLPKEGTRKFVRPFIMIGATILHGCYRLLDLVGLDDIISRIHSRVSGKDAYRYKAVDGMQGVLADLSKKYTLGIISSGGRESTAAFVRAFKLEDCVTEVISAQDCRFIKPHPMPLKKFAEDQHTDIADTMLVGDTIYDAICANRAGAKCVLVKTGFDSEFFMRLFHKGVILDSVRDLPEILKSSEELGVRSEELTESQ